MDTLPDHHSKFSSNSSPHRRGEREGVLNKAQSSKVTSCKYAAIYLQPHVLSYYAAEKSRDSLVYLTTCMIGHLVEVHLKNGSVYSGIFHAADVEKDFGIVLKMASLIKDSTLRVHRSRSEFFRKAPFRTFTIPADELVQVVAEDLSVSSDDTLNAVLSEKPVELLTDSSISKSRHIDLGRELTHWGPDGYVPPGQDNMFDGTSKSGFNEDDILLDTCNDQTSGGSSTSSVQKSASSSGKGHEDVPSDSQPSRNNRNVDHSCSISGDDARHLPSEQRSKDFPAPGSSISESQLGEPRKNNNPEVSHSSRSAEESVSGHGDIKEDAKHGGSGTSASKIVAERERQGSQVSGKTKSESSFGQSDSRSPESLPAPSTPSRPRLPPSSSIGSLFSSEKSTLNPDAKFKQFESGMDTLPDHQSKSSSNVSPHRREKSRDSLVYLTTCMIGHLVEVHLKNGSIYSGIFHAADVEKDFGIVLKMASLIKDSTLLVHKSRSEFYRKLPSKTFIIPADELVQVVAEDLSVSSDGTLNTVQSEKPVDLLTDSSISKSLRVDPEIEAGRAVDEFADSGFNEEDKLLDTCNDQSFGGSSTSSVQKPASSSGKGYEGEVGDSQSSRNNTNVDQSCSISGDDARHLSPEQRSKDYPAPGSSISESQLGERRENNNPEVSHSSRSAEASVSGHGVIKEGPKVGGGGTSVSKIVAERERQGSRVSGKAKSESSFGQSDSRNPESLPALSTPSRPGLPPSSSIGSLSSSEKSTLNPDAKVKQFESAMVTLPDPQSKSSSNGSPHRREKSRDSLVYLTTCMIGHPVEVHLKNGSVYSGIFHAADVEKDFGIVLKMASLIKDSTLRVHRSRSEFFRKAPFRTFTIPADELVQVVAEDLSVSSDDTLNAVLSEKPVELLTDSSISKSRHVDLGRELTHWGPDGYVPPGLDNMFDDTSKSGFNEDDILLDTCNDQTSGGSSTSSVQKSASSSGKGHEDVPSDSQPSRNNRNVDHSCSISGDDARHLPSEQRSKDFPAPGSSISESQLGEPRKNNNPEVSHSSRSAEESVSGHGVINKGPKVGGGGTSASKIVAERQRQGSRVSGKTKSEISFGQSDSRSPESLPSPSTPSRPGLPLSSSIGSLSSSEKSTLNPDAKFESGMDTLPDHQSKSSSNVSPHRREKSRDNFVYLTTCMIGHLVEVHLKNGSVYSGIFHAADVEKNFGIVLKMASLIKDSTLRVHKSRSEFYRKPPFKTFIIPADELVQVVAEDLSVSSDGTLNTVQSQKPVELLTDSSIVQKPTSSSGKGYGDVVGDSQPSRNYTNVDQSCSVSGEDARHLPSEQRSKVFSAPGSSISESQLGEPRKNDNPEVSHSSRSAEESVSGHGDIKEGAKIGGGGTSASKTVSERERQGSQVSGKTKSESSFEQSDCRSSESRPAPSTPSLPGLLPSSSIGSLSSSEKFTFNRGAKEFKPSQPPAVGQAQSPMEYTSFYCPVAPPIQQMPVQAQFPMADGSFYYPAPPVQQMPGGYGIQPQYFEHYPMFYYQYYGQQYGQTGYPQYAQAQYPQQQQQQMMMGHPPMPQMMIGQPSRPPPPNQPENPNNEGRE